MVSSKLASQHDWSGEVLLGPLACATVCLDKAVLRLVRKEDEEEKAMVDKLQSEETHKGYEVDDSDGEDVGVEWFYALLEAETPRTRDYAPTRKVNTYAHIVMESNLRLRIL